MRLTMEHHTTQPAYRLPEVFWPATMLELESVISKVFPPIPLETAKAARSIFGRGNFYLATGDLANHLFSGLDLDHSLRIHCTNWSVAMFYLVTIFQFKETLPDHQAAEALRKRVDWKYALHLPLSYPGLNCSSFCEFRSELLLNPILEQNLSTLLRRLAEEVEPGLNGSFSKNPRQVITAVCTVSRVAKVWETISQALEAVALRQPEWLLAISLPHWYARYGYPGRSPNLRAERGEQEALAQAIGTDGFHLLQAIAAAQIPKLQGLREVSTLEQVWREQYDASAGVVTWRKEACAGCLWPV